MNRLMRYTASASIAISLSGCGGGTGSPTPIGVDKSTAVGDARVSFNGNAKPAISVSNAGVTVQGLSGAAFNFIDFYPQPSLLNTSLVYSYAHQIWTYSFLTGQSTDVTHFLDSYIDLSATWGQNGLLLVPINGSLDQMYADGTHLTSLSMAGATVEAQASPDGSKIIGIDSGHNLVEETSTGGGLHQLVSAADFTFGERTFTWVGNSTVAFVANDHNIWTIPAAGGTSTLVRSVSSSSAQQLAGFQDGTLAVMDSINSTMNSLTWGNQSSDVAITRSGTDDTYPTMAPDNQTLAFYRQMSGSQNDGYSGIWTSDITGENAKLLIPDATSTDVPFSFASHIEWSPYPTYRRFVGTGGNVTTASSGFLISEVGPGFSSFFTFQATTPSTATITPATTGGTTAPLIFSVHADALVGLWFKNGYSLPATAVTPTGATDATVSFNGTNGQITLVAPALATRGISEKPTIETLGATTICTGHFAGVYDGTGKNLATSGASSLTIDSKSGKLLSWK